MVGEHLFYFTLLPSCHSRFILDSIYLWTVINLVSNLLMIGEHLFLLHIVAKLSFEIYIRQRLPVTNVLKMFQ